MERLLRGFRVRFHIGERWFMLMLSSFRRRSTPGPELECIGMKPIRSPETAVRPVMGTGGEP